MNEIEYMQIIRQHDYRILHGGRNKGTGDIRQILKDEILEMDVPTKTLAKTEDFMEIEFGVANLLRHFHVLVFWKDRVVQEILELSGRGDAGNLLWNRCYSAETGFGKSKWVDSMINQHIMANPSLLFSNDE